MSRARKTKSSSQIGDLTPAPSSAASTQSLSDPLFTIAFHKSPAMQTVTRFSDRRIVEVNETFVKRLGYAREELIGRTAAELKFWVTPEKEIPFREQLARQGFVRDFEIDVYTKSGEIRSVLLSADLVPIDGVPHLIAAGVDITARKQAEASLQTSDSRLRESEGRFSKAFQSCPVLMTMARLADGKFVEVNPAFVAHVGYSRDKIIGRDSMELGLWVDLQARSHFFERLRQERVVRDYECQVKTRGGRRHTMQISGEIIEINGEAHLLTYAVDVTDRKQAEAELHNALEKERELNQLKSDFVALVSHEFRTPLEIILSSADNLQRYHDRLPAEKRDQLLNTIHKSVRRMAGMMEEVLILGRVESGRTEFKPKAFPIAAFCARVSEEIQTATARRCPVEVQLSEVDATAFGDENLLRHILTNLLSNAVKYSPEGRSVCLRVEQNGTDAFFRIVDQGCGIPAADQARLFQAFHRGGNVRQVPGTGLGLVIVKRCVELHGGRIECQSVEGEGTTFVVTVPLFSLTKPDRHERNPEGGLWV